MPGQQASTSSSPEPQADSSMQQARCACIQVGAVQWPSRGKHPVWFYFSADTALALEHARKRLRDMAGVGRRSRITKSAIVELAILAVLADSETKGKHSWIARQLVGDG